MNVRDAKRASEQEQVDTMVERRGCVEKIGSLAARKSGVRRALLRPCFDEASIYDSLVSRESGVQSVVGGSIEIATEYDRQRGVAGCRDEFSDPATSSKADDEIMVRPHRNFERYLLMFKHTLSISNSANSSKSRCVSWSWSALPANKLAEHGSFRASETLFCRFAEQTVADVVLGGLEAQLRTR
jgi:hypothetical protein